MLHRLAPLLLFAGSCLAAPAEAPALLQPPGDAAIKDRAHDGGKRALMLGFLVKPQSFAISHNVQFNDQGEIQHENHSAQLQLTVVYGPDVRPVTYDTLQITKLTDHRGAEISLPDAGGRSHPINDNDNRQFNFSVALPTMPMTAEGIGVMEGMLTVRCGLGEQRHARLGKAAELDGRRIRVQGLDQEIAFTIRREQQHKRVKVEMPRSAAGHVSNLTFTDAAGNALPSRGGGYSYDENQVTRYFYLEWPDEGRATASFYTAVEAVAVPVTLRNLPLRKPIEPKNQTDLVVQAVPADQLKAAAQPVQEPADDQQLRVLID